MLKYVNTARIFKVCLVIFHFSTLCVPVLKTILRQTNKKQHQHNKVQLLFLYILLLLCQGADCISTCLI